MQNIVYKYRLGGVAVLFLSIFIYIILISNLDFSDRYFVLAVGGLLIMILLFIAGLVLVLQRLSKVRFKQMHVYFAIGLFNLFTSLSFLMQLIDGLMSWMWIIILLPLFVGVFSIIDIYNLDKKAARIISK